MVFGALSICFAALCASAVSWGEKTAKYTGACSPTSKQITFCMRWASESDCDLGIVPRRKVWIGAFIEIPFGRPVVFIDVGTPYSSSISIVGALCAALFWELIC